MPGLSPNRQGWFKHDDFLDEEPGKENEGFLKHWNFGFVIPGLAGTRQLQKILGKPIKYQGKIRKT